MPQAATTVAERTRDSAGSAGSTGSDFAPLLRAVKGQGLLERRTGWYAAGIAANLIALGAVLTGMVLLGNTWWTLLLALPLAIFWSRTAFVGHDAGHAQISGDRRASRAIGLVHANLLLGMNEAWWNDKHVRHHANPNHVDKDPDVGVGALVWTQKQAAQREGFARWLTRNQARLFFPMLLLEGIALKISGFQYLRQQPARERVLSALLLVAHLGLYATLLLTVMSPGKAVVFALVHHALFGLHLGMAFAPNHKGMEMPDPDGDRWATCSARSSPHATYGAPSSPTGSSAGSTTRSSTTSSLACPARTCGWLSPGQGPLRGARHAVRGDRTHRVLPPGPRPHARGRRAAQVTVPDGFGAGWNRWVRTGVLIAGAATGREGGVDDVEQRKDRHRGSCRRSRPDAVHRVLAVTAGAHRSPRDRLPGTRSQPAAQAPQDHA